MWLTAVKCQTQNNEPLVSIIVPVFQVEKYLDKCISSILAQTHHNLEVILVDDGSTDNCPAICNQFQKMDNRIKVIHKENGGLSQTRNVGLKLAKGDFIGFVDSDDWIEPNMYAILISVLIETGADIAVCNYMDEPEDPSFVKRKSISPEVKLYSSEEALKKVIDNDGYIKSFVWNKLYRKTVLSNIFFSEGKIHEDTLWTTKIIGNAKLLVYIDYPLYHYLYRSESLSHNNLQLSQRLRDIIEMNIQRIEYIHEYYPVLEKKAILRLQNLCYDKFLNIHFNYSHLDPDEKMRHELYHQFCQFGLTNLLAKENLKIKIGKVLFWICPYILLKIHIIYHRLKF